MPSLLSRYQHDASARSSLALSLTLLVSSVLAYLGTPVKHSLLTSAVVWLSLCTYTSLELGRSKSVFEATPSQRLAWAAGALLALAQVCERAVDGRGIWWAKGLIPVVIYCFARSDIIGKDAPASSDSPPASPEKARAQVVDSGSKTSLAILSSAAVVATFAATGSNATIALGLSYAIIEASALLLVERARSEAQHGRQNGGVIYSANGLLAQPARPGASGFETQITVIRDVSTAAALATGLAALTLESFTFGGLAYWGLIGQVMGEKWVIGNAILTVLYALATIVVHLVVDGTLVTMIQRRGSFLTSFIPLSAAVCSQLVVSFSLGRIWFAALCAASAYIFFDEQDTFSGGLRKRMRFGKILTLIAITSFGVLSILHLRQPFQLPRFHAPVSSHTDDELSVAPPPDPLAPLEFTNIHVHPVDQLVRDAEQSWLSTLDSQSQSLEAAVTEYKRRYGIPPPPNFDKWYEFAKRKGVQLIDEYDGIYHSMLPFWALPPTTIRARAREALGFGPNMVMGLLVRDGKAKYVEGGQDWLQQAAVGMMEQFVQYLPDVDLVFNTHDEPRVVVPHDELSRLVRIAKDENMPAALKHQTPRNAFSSRPADVDSGQRVAEVKTTRFNVYAHQPVWLPSRLSCSPESPARPLDDLVVSDNLTAYALGELGFVYNHTAFSDVCNSPSLGTSHGFFDRPNAFNVVHDLFPIFSQSKMSSFQDILYPSPWYWYGKVEYDGMMDIPWDTKINKLYWRGSTTGGFSRNGGWRRQHRQKVVGRLNGLDSAKIMQDANKDSEDPDAPEWKIKEVQRNDYSELMDVHFSHVGQCDEGDCDAQREFFDIVKGDDQQAAWKYRYLLDIDGNAFSGRFYAFLKSHSLTFKMAVFREWHEEWIKPWVHYIPLSLSAEEALESVRYLSAEPEGKQQAIRMAEAGRDWAGKALRNEDFEVWFFRLLLEYGRVVDDDRANIGYSGS